MHLMVFDEFNNLLFISLDKCTILNASHVSVKTPLVPVRLNMEDILSSIVTYTRNLKLQ